MCGAETAFAVQIVGGLGEEEAWPKGGGEVVRFAGRMRAGDVVFEGVVGAAWGV